MCLVMRDNGDYRLLNQYHTMGHRLIYGYKVLKRDYAGRAHSRVYSLHTWKKGWNVARRGQNGECLKVKRFKPKKVVRAFAERFRSLGIHVYVTRSYAISSTGTVRGLFVQPVWFYADEVVAATRHDSPVHASRTPVVVVPRVNIKRFVK